MIHCELPRLSERLIWIGRNRGKRTERIPGRTGTGNIPGTDASDHVRTMEITILAHISRLFSLPASNDKRITKQQFNTVKANTITSTPDVYKRQLYILAHFLPYLFLNTHEKDFSPYGKLVDLNFVVNV